LSRVVAIVLLVLLLVALLKAWWASDRHKQRHWQTAAFLLAIALLCSLVSVVQP
jgi:hypothetical protein